MAEKKEFIKKHEVCEEEMLNKERVSDLLQRRVSLKDVVDWLMFEGELETGKYEFIKPDDSKKGHGSCCYCRQCGYLNDDCVCNHNYNLRGLLHLAI